MKVIYSPLLSTKEIDYKCNKEQILATINDDELLFDLSNIERGKQYEVQYPIRDVVKNEDGELEVTLVKYHDANAPYKELFPESFEAVNEEFETDLEPIQLEEVIIEEVTPRPSSEDLLMLAIADLDEQREKDKLDQQLAMAELAETLIGGDV